MQANPQSARNRKQKRNYFIVESLHGEEQTHWYLTHANFPERIGLWRKSSHFGSPIR